MFMVDLLDLRLHCEADRKALIEDLCTLRFSLIHIMIHNENAAHRLAETRQC